MITRAIGWWVIGGVIGLLGICLRLLSNYSTRWDSGNSSAWRLRYGFLLGGKDSTVYAYRRSTRELQQDNDRRLDEMRTTHQTTEPVADAPVIETKEGV